jgi:hypothetical protein
MVLSTNELWPDVPNKIQEVIARILKGLQLLQTVLEPEDLGLRVLV